MNRLPRIRRACAVLATAIGCLAFNAIAMVAIRPARAQTPITPALKCAALPDLKIPGSTIVITSAQALPEAPPGTASSDVPVPLGPAGAP